MIWSDKCNNPSEGYTIESDASMKMKAPLGYWVFTLEEAERNAWWNKQ